MKCEHCGQEFAYKGKKVDSKYLQKCRETLCSDCFSLAENCYRAGLWDRGISMIRGETYRHNHINKG